MQDSLLHLGPVLPASVVVVFPKLCTDAIPLDAEYTVTINLRDLPEWHGLRGYTGAKTFRDRTWARVTSSAATPTNLADLTLLATRIARDFYRWRTQPLDRKYVGTLSLDHNGLCDEIEYTHAALPGGLLEIGTRVMRGPFNGEPEELLHQLGGEVPSLELPFFVRLDSYDGDGAYRQWTQMREVAGGGYEEVPLAEGGFRGPANGVMYHAELARVRVPSIVTAWPSAVCDWRFERCCTAEGEVLSGSGTGAGDDLIITDSCPEGVPRQLVAQITDEGGDCPLIAVQVVLTYNAAVQLWAGSASCCGGDTVQVFFGPHAAGGSLWQVGLNCGGTPAFLNANLSSCSPFEWNSGVQSATNLGGNCCPSPNPQISVQVVA